MAIRWSLLAVTLGTLLSPSLAAFAQAPEECKKAERIIGGVPADIEDHSWQVALDIKGGLCGGSIIAHKWVLTAAHCFNEGSQPVDVRVKSGSSKHELGGAWSAVERVVIHQRYQAALNEAMKIQEARERADAIELIPSMPGFDLALVKLKFPPIGLVIPLAPPQHQLRPCDLLEVTGWGRTTERGPPSSVLLKATVPYIDNAVCNEPDAYDGRIKSSMMCAGYQEGGIDSCQGDSGGPLVFKGPDGPVLVGVVSWGEGCARKLKYGVYTRATTYRDWIAAVITSDRN